MNADVERYPPPNDPVMFESLCLHLWKEIWGDPEAKKNGRSGQPQAGVDVFGRCGGRQMGVQCKQKDRMLGSALTVRELDAEVAKALKFKPPLATFTVATSGPADAKVQERARVLTVDHEARGLFGVEIWSWTEIWQAICDRPELLRRIAPIYWPLTVGLQARRVAPTRLRHAAATLFGRDDELARLDAAWDDPPWSGAGQPCSCAGASNLMHESCALGGTEVI